MQKRPNNFNALSWRRLHLSRAKLKASSRTSALLSGFAMVAMVEVQLTDKNDTFPLSLLIAFAICTTLLVSIHMLALLISTCILPHVESIAMLPGMIGPDESPHEKLSIYIELAWVFSTVFGILLFLVEIAILFWLRFAGNGECNLSATPNSDCSSNCSCCNSKSLILTFQPSQIAFEQVKFWDLGDKGWYSAVVGTILLIPICVIFILFSIHFYRKLVGHKYSNAAKGLHELEAMVSQLHGDPANIGEYVPPAHVIQM